MNTLRILQSLVYFEFRTRWHLAFVLIPLLVVSSIELNSRAHLSIAFFQSPLVSIFIISFIAGMVFCPSKLPAFQSRNEHHSFLEFLFSRALNRSHIFHAKTFALLLVLALPLLLMFPWVAAEPDFTINFYHRDEPAAVQKAIQQYQAVFPDAEVRFDQNGKVPESLTLPQGRLFLYTWKLAFSLFLALTAQGLLLWLSPWKHIKKVFTGIYAAFLTIALLPALAGSLLKRHDLNSFLLYGGLLDPLILSFGRHPWTWTAGLLIYGTVMIQLTRGFFLKTEVE